MISLSKVVDRSFLMVKMTIMIGLLCGFSEEDWQFGSLVSYILSETFDETRIFTLVDST